MNICVVLHLIEVTKRLRYDTNSEKDIDVSFENTIWFTHLFHRYERLFFFELFFWDHGRNLGSVKQYKLGKIKNRIDNGRFILDSLIF